MTNKGYFSVSDFAKFSRTTRDTLLYYDKIGLLSPIQRGGNHYRYYSGYQLAIINLIRTLQTLGMTLEDIKNFKEQRTPASVDEVLTSQIEKIDIKIQDWLSARKLLLTFKKTIHSVLDIDETAISVQFMPAEAILLGDLNDYSRGRDEYDALLSFYQDCNEKYPHLDLNYPAWGFISEKRLKQGDWIWPDRYYFYNPEGPDRKPASLYAIGYTRGGYGQTSELYERMISYIDKNSLKICGDAYEEYPLNEVCIADDANYLIRLMVPVQEEKKRK